jgi:prepilin-type N-terminal cleavage/methylation domain-containing protein
MKRSEKGFTLIETLAALAIASFISFGLIVLSGQLLMTWRSSVNRTQNIDLLTDSILYLHEKIANAVVVSGRVDNFYGDDQSVRFISPSTSGLEVINIQAKNFRLVQNSRLMPTGPSRLTEITGFETIQFEYLSEKGHWQNQWQDQILPKAVRVNLKANDNHFLPFVLLVPLRTNLPAVCSRASTLSICLGMATGQPVGLPQPNSSGRLPRERP